MVIIFLGTQNAMEKKVMEAEEQAYLEGQREDEDSSGSDGENYGKGCRAKKYRKLDDRPQPTETRVSLTLLLFIWHL